MDLQLAYELWLATKPYLHTVDKGDAADAVVSILIDADYDINDIRSVFRSERDIINALEYYDRGHPEDDLDLEDDEEYEDDTGFDEDGWDEDEY